MVDSPSIDAPTPTPHTRRSMSQFRTSIATGTVNFAVVTCGDGQASQRGKPMSLIADLKSLEPSQRSAIWASYLGWTLDAFDFFLMVFMLSAIAKEFGHRRQGGVAGCVPDARRAADRRFRLRLARRALRPPAGADGRHHPLLAFRVRLGLRADADELLRAPLPVRLRDGRRMGPRREPGDGIIPARLRGPVSGLLQSGYPSGYFVASLVYFLLFDTSAGAACSWSASRRRCSSSSSACT